MAAFGANSRLYLKDGDYQLVREYQVLADRVRYFSTERGDWEEIPIELVDLERTKKDATERQATIDAEAKQQDLEDKAIREERKEMARVPLDPGVYYVNGDKLQTIPLAETEVISNKSRTVLKVLSPIPIVPGKSSVEIKGEAAALALTSNSPEFYFRLMDDERFALIKLTRKKNSRLVETVAILPVTNEVIEDLKQVATFKSRSATGATRFGPRSRWSRASMHWSSTPRRHTQSQLWDFGVGSRTRRSCRLSLRSYLQRPLRGRTLKTPQRSGSHLYFSA